MISWRRVGQQENILDGNREKQIMGKQGSGMKKKKYVDKRNIFIWLLSKIYCTKLACYFEFDTGMLI